MEHGHQWGTWFSAADQMGSIYPDAEGKLWFWYRDCNIMGCSARQYAEGLAIVGDSKIVELKDRNNA